MLTNPLLVIDSLHKEVDGNGRLHVFTFTFQTLILTKWNNFFGTLDCISWSRVCSYRIY